jgi:outer membrane protein assembly factor BamA
MRHGILLKNMTPNFLKVLVIIFITQLFYLPNVFSQEIKPADNISGWTGYPVIFYTSRTNFAFGGYGIRHFKYDGSPHNSTISSALVYTLKGQIMTQLAGKFYWPEYRLKADIDYLKFPDTFYGIGNNTPATNAEDFSTERIGLDLNFQKEFLSNLYIGFLYDFEKHNLRETEPGGILSQRVLPGTQGAFNLSGLGFSVNYDTRDHVVYCCHGSYFEFNWTFYDNAIGSDYRFMEYYLDLRHYFRVNKNGVLAFQGTYNRVSGYAPIQAYPVLGDDRLRGFSARYMDKNLLTLQAEYRMSILKKLGLVFFAGMGDVANRFSDFNPSEFKFGAGIGFRYTILPENKLNLRFDFGIGTHANSSMTFLPGEAF